MNEFNALNQELKRLIDTWEPRLLVLPNHIISERRNKQHRTVKQILGHLVDSATNNTHRIVHLQYEKSPLQYPNYATNGNNDRWIAIQQYQEEDWEVLINLWKYSNLHIIHIINCVDESKLGNTWQNAENSFVSLKDIIQDYYRHIKLHLEEINELIVAS
ncbi:MAG TPA: DinB family protein [Bacteroidales bacterium]